MDVEEDFDELEPNWPIFDTLELPSATFTIVLLTTLILPYIGIFSKSFGNFAATIFGLSVIASFPISAILSYITKENVSIKGNISLVVIFSYITNLLLNYQQGLWNITMKYFFAIPLILLILVIFELFYKYLPYKPKTWQKQGYYLIFVCVPTIIVVSSILYLSQTLEILKFAEIGKAMEVLMDV